MRRIVAILLTSLILLSGCTPASSPEVAGEIGVSGGGLTIGFSQVGAESDWRRENTESMRSTFSSENGYRLIIEDGQQKQANQTMSIRRFIQQGVDYIVLAPVTEAGWEPVLEEAKEAGIPVIVVDRMVDVDDPSLYTCWVGSDFEAEADKVMAWLEEYLAGRDIDASDIHIADIQGTAGASAQIGRTKGLEDACAKNGWDLVDVVDGDFTEAKGKEAMNSLLAEHDDINIVYCENDNEALGAVEAIEAAGGRVGVDIEAGDTLVLSFDGINTEAMELLRQKKIACIAECNPDHGPRVKSLIDMIEAGKIPDKRSYVSEGIYSGDREITHISVDDMNYSVTIVGE